MILRVALRTAGIFCLCSALLPLVVYGIFNTGVITLFVLAAALLVLPSAWGGLLAPYAWLRWSIAVAACLLLVFFLAVSALMCYRAWWNPPPDTGKTAVIVLGGKVVGDQPTLMLRRRLQQAKEYLEHNPDAFCVVSGGQGADEDYPEAVVMRSYLIGRGIAPDRIHIEDTSTNTRQNLRFSAALLDGDEQVVIVTDSFHQLRASLFAAAEGMPSTNLSSLTPWGLMPSYWMREILGVSWAFLSIRLAL